MNEQVNSLRIAYLNETFFHIRAQEDKEVYSEGRLRDEEPNYQADFQNGLITAISERDIVQSLHCFHLPGIGIIMGSSVL